MTQPIRVLIVDDHALIRDGLGQLIAGEPDLELVGALAAGREAVDQVNELAPDVVLMDISMPGGMDGIAATRELLQRRPATYVVMLTSYAEDESVVAALDAGASGYLLKDAESADVLRGVRAAAKGEAPLAPKAARAMLVARHRPRNDEHLTVREEDVLRLVGQGLPNKLIARELGISEKTVKAHLTNVFQRIGVASRTEAALWAKERLHRS
jgi:DNA-binding NarL/FixJ family response regulator